MAAPRLADVRRAVAFARDNDLPLAVRGGAHNIAGSAVCDDGLMIDLSPMKSVRVDPAARRAYVEPGATLADFDHEAQAFGLATPLGINSTTGVSGVRPASAAVGTSGSTGLRVFVPTANALIAPACSCATAAGTSALM